MRQAPVGLLIVHPVPDDKDVRDLKAVVRDWEIDYTPSRFIQKRAYLDVCRFALSESLQQVAASQSGIDDVFDQQHVAPGDTLVEILRYAYDSRTGLTGVTGDSHEVYRALNCHRAKQVRSEDE